ncbi:DNA (cytosine-5-)-methyltransferase, partial [Bacillus altitudinis]|nr:DNA (cytosine-5-)-methyltransferase [Bacillus altitudinis]
IRAEHHGNIEAHYRTTNEDEPENMAYWRRLTVRECARIQSFPDSFEFLGAGTYTYKQVGNAVPPVLGWHVAQSIQNVLLANDNLKLNNNNELSFQF